MLKEFKEFAMRGNVVDMAVGIIIGAAFGKIVSLAVFMLIKGINSMKKKEEAKPAEPAKPSKEEALLTEIRDLLAK